MSCLQILVSKKKKKKIHRNDVFVGIQMYRTAEDVSQCQQVTTCRGTATCRLEQCYE
jgi:hypothetical protein